MKPRRTDGSSSQYQELITLMGDPFPEMDLGNLKGRVMS